MALVVVGGVAAGMSAAARARRLDPGLPIIVLEKGPVVSYSACGLPYLLEGRVREAAGLIVHTSEYFGKERNIEVRTGARVTAIAHPRREVVLESGERIKYDRLVIASGARCDTSAIAGAGRPHVFTLHTLDDAERLRGFLRERKPRRAAVVGGGYIGVEVADALRRNGLHVTVLERGANVLLRDDEAFSGAVRKTLETHGVELRCGVNVEEIEADRVTDVRCDLVVIAAGFKPNAELAGDAGVAIGRTGAIAADDHMETSIRGIFAAGDCAEVTHLVTGRPTWIPLGTTANKTGRVAGANAAGGRERFPGVVGTCIVGIFGTAFAATGLSVAQARAEGLSPVNARIEALTRPRYYSGVKTTVELVADRITGRLIGGTVIGEEGAAGRINAIAAALHNRMRVEDLERMDLAYSPPFSSVWDPLLIAAQQLSRQL